MFGLSTVSNSIRHIELQRILGKNRDLTELLFSLILDHRENAADILGLNCCKHGTAQIMGRTER